MCVGARVAVSEQCNPNARMWASEHRSPSPVPGLMPSARRRAGSTVLRARPPSFTVCQHELSRATRRLFGLSPSLSGVHVPSLLAVVEPCRKVDILATPARFHGGGVRTHERPLLPRGCSRGVRMRVRLLIGEPEPDAALRPHPLGRCNLGFSKVDASTITATRDRLPQTHHGPQQ